MTQIPPASFPASPGHSNGRPLLAYLYRFPVARFLGSLVLFLLVAPWLDSLKNGALLEVGVLTLVLCAGVLAVGRRRRTLVVALLLLLPAVAGNWLNHFWPQKFAEEGVFVTRMLFVTFVAIRLLIFILHAPRVNSEVLCAGISVYLLLGLIWALAYRLAALTPDAFNFSVPPNASHTMSGFNVVYFSFITLTTVGYGDITPVSNLARMLTILEAMTGTLFVGILIARLVSLYSAAGPSAAADAPDSGIVNR